MGGGAAAQQRQPHGPTGQGAVPDGKVLKDGHLFNAAAPQAKAGAREYDILTGDHGLEPQRQLNDFIWTESPEPHLPRKLAMMKELGPQIAPLQGHEPLTKWITLALLGAQVGLGVWLREEALWGGTLRFWLVAYCVGATLTQALFLANHEISHNGAFKGVNSNKLFGILVNLPLVLPYFIAFKDYHNEHHKHQGTENIDTDLPTALEARLLSSTLGKLVYMFNQTWFYALRPVFTKPQPFTSWHGLNAAVQVAFLSAVVRTWGWGPVFYYLASAHLAGSWHPLASHFIAEHYTFAGEAETCSYYGWMNWLTWNVGYHNEHHDFPNVPWSRLPALNKVGGKHYSELPYHKSWVMALWTFLFDPSINFYNRVKRSPK
jgi:sphingolipid delta-4 desaturase